MKLKYLAIVLVVFLFLGASCAKDISELTDDDLKKVKYFDKDTVIDVNGINFTIPKGFGHLDDFDINETEGNISSDSLFYVNEKNETLMVSELYGKGINLNLDDYKEIYPDAEYETINGIDGIEFEDKYDYFVYINGDKVVILEAPDENYFSIMIKNE